MFWTIICVCWLHFEPLPEPRYELRCELLRTGDVAPPRDRRTERGGGRTRR